MGRIALLVLASLPTLAAADDGVVLAPLSERLIALFGRLHPTLVHFPICLLIVTAALELGSLLRRNSEINRIGLYALVWSAVCAFVATLAGLANSAHQEFLGESADFLSIHLWGGLVVTAIAIISSLVGLGSCNIKPDAQLVVYRSLTIGNALLMCFMAHYGGLLVHGADYFEEPLTLAASETFSASTDGSESGRASLKRSALNKKSSSAAVIPPPSRRKINFEKDIEPILKENCAKCHDDGKSKGDYRIDNRDLFIKGGKDGPAAVPGESHVSYVVKLISGVEPKKIMPSKGRRLTDEEIGVIRAWIDQGMTWGAVVRKNVLTPKKSTAPRRPAVPVVSDSTGSNPVDAFISTYWSSTEATRNLSFNTSVSDEVFAKRVYFDLHGLTPSSDQISRFTSSKSPTKRRDLIRSLLSDRKAFASHWLTWWNDLLRNDYSGPGFLHGGRQDNSSWIYASLYNNTPYNTVVQQLISPSRDNDGFIKGVKWWQAGNVNANEETGMQAAQNVGQLFMGINLKCASCHNSFTDEWKLRETYAFANAFSQKSLGVHECNVPTGETMQPGFLYPELGTVAGGSSAQRRSQAAMLVTSDQNGRFARTFVNRVWQRLFGAGIIEPLDEMDQPAWSDDLLDWLASEFVAQRYDTNALLELVMSSRAYQLPSVGATEKVTKPYHFRGPHVRRKNAEELIDGVAGAFNVIPAALSSDVERALAVTVLNTKLADAPQTQANSILFKSGEVRPNGPAVPFDVNLSGDDSSVWLVVLRRFEKVSELERQRKQFEQIQKQDSGALEIEVSSSQTQRDKQSQRVKGIKKNALKESADENYSAIFDTLRFHVGTKTLPLLSVDPSPHVIEERPVETATTEGVNADKPKSFVAIERDTIRTKAFSAIRINTGGLKPTRLTGRVLASSPQVDNEHAVEFLVVRDLDLRAVFLESTPDLLNLGRPRREQITTRRATAASTMQVLELSTGDALTDLIHKSANVVVTSNRLKKPQSEVPLQAAAKSAFNQLLGREPGTKELEALRATFGSTVTQSEAEDLIWSVCMLPDFQLIT
jgi:uncharacterized membrane protein